MKTGLVCLAAILLASGCVQKKGEKACPQEVREAPVISETSVQMLLVDSPRFNNKKVIVSGKVFREETMAPDAMFIIQYLAARPGESEGHGSGGHASRDRELRLKVKYTGAAGITFNSWIRVQGTIKDMNQELVLEAESLSVIPKPVSPGSAHEH